MKKEDIEKNLKKAQVEFLIEETRRTAFNMEAEVFKNYEAYKACMVTIRMILDKLETFDNFMKENS